VAVSAPTWPTGWTALFAAWIVALVATLGALFIGEVMGQAPCLLCWFQRVFMFPLVLLLGIALYRSDRGIWRYALPLAGVGLLIALYHLLLYAGIIPQAIQPCGAGPSCAKADLNVIGVVPIPLLSLMAFSAISGFLLLLRSKGGA
jgi:disulfide bond formation protein DsbB